MREIKFRYRLQIPADFEKKGNKPYIKTEVYTLEQIETGLRIYTHSMVKVLTRDLYTGLKDKNGKEIYEGDIVQRYNDYGQAAQRSRRVIKYNLNRHFVGFNIGVGQSVNNIEIIGNIYENPELLK